MGSFPHAAKQRPDKFRRAISGSLGGIDFGYHRRRSAGYGAFRLLGGRDLSAVDLGHLLRDIGIPIRRHQHPVTALKPRADRRNLLNSMDPNA